MKYLYIPDTAKLTPGYLTLELMLITSFYPHFFIAPNFLNYEKLEGKLTLCLKCWICNVEIKLHVIVIAFLIAFQ